jgi:hypothetical protein
MKADFAAVVLPVYQVMKEMRVKGQLVEHKEVRGAREE